MPPESHLPRIHAERTVTLHDTSLASALDQWDRQIRAALDWLVVSWERCGRTGSAAYYSPLFGWSAPYPETTGYIIPTLWRAADRYAECKYAHAASGMATWLLTLQAADGWFPGGVYRAGRNPRPSIFNTGQILFGLLEASRRTGKPDFQSAAERAAAWLLREQDADGRWRRHAYRPGYSPSYYAHVCWPLAESWRQRPDPAVRDAVICGLTAIASDRLPNGVYTGWGFAPRGPAFTHTIAYTLQGIIEAALILGEWDRFAVPAAQTAETLMRKFELKRQLAGAYDARWNGADWYACLTGHCQLASTWLRIYERTDDPRFLNVAVKAVEFVLRRQRWSPGFPSLHGAIAGSSPLFGRYLSLRYPNWAAKFFVDAATDVRDALGLLSERPAPQVREGVAA
jgi:hypothetical protein